MKTIPKKETSQGRVLCRSRRAFLRQTGAACLGGFALGAARLLSEEGASGENSVWSEADYVAHAVHVSLHWQDCPIPLKVWREADLRQPHDLAG
ncbi:MAG: hypothetical protein NTX50_19470 [Candidatus Sumerlaeota bacterium]|nr:hypothetical protein [Candidatus Sumerlaeota bacterium]